MDIKDIKFDKDDINAFTSFLTDKSGNKGWKIKVNGEFIRMKSGKQLWTEKSHAKNALKENFRKQRYEDWLPDNLVKKYLGTTYHLDNNKLWNHFLDFLQAKGILEFIELR